MPSLSSKCKCVFENALFVAGSIFLLYFILGIEQVARLLNVPAVDQSRAMTRAALLAVGSPLTLKSTSELLLLSIVLSVGAFMLRSYCQSWGTAENVEVQAAELQSRQTGAALSSERISGGMYMLSSQTEREDLLRRLRDIQKKLDHN
jgi:hypothetical protein